MGIVCSFQKRFSSSKYFRNSWNHRHFEILIQHLQSNILFCFAEQ